MKKYLKYLIAFLAIFLTACSTGELVQNRFYILEYFNNSEVAEFKQEKPIEGTVLIHDANITKPYDRDNIVVRYFGPKITYSPNDFWGIQLEETIPNLVATRLQRYNLFQNIQREYTVSHPDYEINIDIDNIEQFHSKNLNEAHVNMDLILRNREGQELARHQISRESRLANAEMDIFVQKLNNIILEEANEFTRKILARFKNQYRIKPEEPETRKEHFVKDTTIEGKRTGQLLLPSLTKSGNEPPYKIINSRGKDLELPAEMGESIPVPVGDYKIKFGSGRDDQMMEKNVTIRPHYKTVVEPDWSCMLVDVIDDNRNYVQVRYEVFDAKTGESYGTHYPVEKELGEQQKVWVLEPGLYKITINNEPFNTYRNFTTVYLKEGQVEHISLVVEMDENNNPTGLTGAGVLGEFSRSKVSGNWQSSNGLHANLNMNANTRDSEDTPKNSVIINTQFENYLIYNKMPYYYRLRHLSEFGISKDGSNPFRKNSDNMDLKNTFIYFLSSYLGIYSRFDINSHFFQGFYNSNKQFNYIKKNTSGKKVDQKIGMKRVLTTPFIYPLKMKQGLGINFRIFNRPRIHLNLRSGFGLRQDYMNNVYQLTEANYIPPGESTTFRLYNERGTLHNIGTEFSLVGNFNLPFNLSYRTNADLLIPFERDSRANFDWENDFNLRLFKYISVYYRVDVSSDPEDFKKFYIDQSLFLRLSYFFQ
ncbi:MAG: ABC-type transport auxiliary lipoprotein family protein [Candidatus Marinimicrobia bacterium]|nr:ABC-type transport auxiliary lipoprotein family protein [Candidatus Neomarinimicrobiota bacterium]